LASLAPVCFDCIEFRFIIELNKIITFSDYLILLAGLGGSARLLDVGGVPYLTPVPNLKKIYNMRQIAKDVGLEQGFFIGSGAASHRLAGLNCEVLQPPC
jgi:hypothetical protein